MTNTNTSNRKQSRMAKGVGMLLVVALLFSAQAPTAEASWGAKRDWSRVQAVRPGTRTTVLLHGDLAPRGKRKIKGRFHSATAESITILLGVLGQGQGQTRTVEKGDVRRVLVYRPVGKRYQVGITVTVGTVLAAAPILIVAGSPNTYNLKIGWVAKVVGVLVGAPTAFALLVAPKMGGIYNVPRNDQKRQKRAAQTTPKPKGP